MVEIFMFEGFKVVYRVGITILYTLEQELMESGFEQILRVCRILILRLMRGGDMDLRVFFSIPVVSCFM